MQPASVATAPAPPVPRKSRRRWYILGFVLVLLATPFAWYFIAGWRSEREIQALYAELDAEDPDWRWRDLVGKVEPIPDDENAVEQISKVTVLAGSPVAFNPGPRWDRDDWISNARLSKAKADAATVAFSRCDPVLRDAARKLKDMPRGCYKLPVEGNLFTVEFPGIQKSRQACYILSIDAALRAYEGDMDGAAESCQAILNTAGTYHNHPILIGFLVRVAEQAIAVAAIERTLGQGTISEPQLKKLQELLQREAEDDGFLHAMRGERAAAHHMYDSIRKGDLALSQLMDAAGKNDSMANSVLDMFPNVILKYYPEYMRDMNERVRICKLEPVERAEKLKAMDRQLRDKSSNLLSRLMMPAVEKVSYASLRAKASLHCAVVAVAAERYRVNHGAWPSKLDDLVKDGLLAKIPSDPYDGKPVRWKRTPSGVLIYSVGMDKVDNGGKLDRNNPRADGTDMGFELFDPKLRGVAAPVED